MYFNFISEINIFNKLLIFAWHDIAFCAESAIKHQPTNCVVVNICLSGSKPPYHSGKWNIHINFDPCHIFLSFRCKAAALCDGDVCLFVCPFVCRYHVLVGHWSVCPTVCWRLGLTTSAIWAALREGCGLDRQCLAALLPYRTALCCAT